MITQEIKLALKDGKIHLEMIIALEKKKVYPRERKIKDCLVKIKQIEVLLK